ncbi:MAG: choice-of-anchor Q domain-containing protein [Armatimonadota bacterium]
MRHRDLLTTLPAALLLAFAGAPAHAAAFTVTQLGDSGAGSLRQAVADANAAAGADIINFQEGLSGTIILTAGPLTLTGFLEIQGPGAATLAVSGNNASRVFAVDPGATVLIRDLAMRDGKYAGPESGGGGIYNRGDLRLLDCVLSNCTAPAGVGGGIFNEGALMVLSTTLRDNTAPIAGGGLFNLQGTVVMRSSLLVTNRTTDPDLTRGGAGIDVEGGTLFADRCIFDRNRASRSGGALLIAPTSSVTLTECHLISNQAVRSGGGVLNSGTLALNDCSIVDNTAVISGGGVENFGGLTVSSSSFSGNSASDATLSEGGGLFNSGNAALSHCSFAQNRAPRAGGGIFNDGILTVTRSALSQNSAGVGAGLANVGTVTVFRSSFESNSAGIAGGALGSGGGNVSLTECRLFANFGAERGGGAHVDGGILTATACTIVGNGTGGLGGGLLNRGDTTVRRCTINGNIASEGGGILNQPLEIVEGPGPGGSPGTIRLENSTLSNNRAFLGGGLSNQAVALLVNCTFYDHSASDGEGGALRNSGIVRLGNTLLARSGVGRNCLNLGLISSEGHNLDSDGTCGLSGSGDQSGTIGMPIDPLLGPLQNNGGPTQTHALLTGSPAIDAGDDGQASGTVDQRGFSRFADGDGDRVAVVDIGAFELGFFPPEPLGDPGTRLLAYSTIQDPTTSLPEGTQAFNLTLRYAANVVPGTLSVKLNGVDVTGLFNPVPSGVETVALPLRRGPNLLSLKVKGTVGGKMIEEVDTLRFIVGDPAFGPK